MWRCFRVTKPADIIQALPHSTITISKAHCVGAWKP